MRFRSGAAALVLLLAVRSGSSQLTEPERRGKAIYTRGTGAAGKEITAVVGNDSTEVSASLFVCSGCHNFDGRGKPEGGVTPSNITWEKLTRPYKVTESSGREHGPYTDRLLGRAITMGLDAAGNRLSEAMPRFRLSREDLTDLTAYLKTLGTLPDPGLAADSIRLGVLLPPDANDEAGSAVAGVLQAYFDGVNRGGGIYGRRVELVKRRLPTDAAALEGGVSAWLREEKVFALVSGFLTGIEDRMATLAEREAIPLIGPLAALPPLTPYNSYVFFLDGGLNEEVEALQKFAEARSGGTTPGMALVVAGGRTGTVVAERLRSRRKGSQVEEIAASDSGGQGAADRVLQSGATAVLIVAPGAVAASMLRTLARSPNPPVCLIPGSIFTSEIFDLPASLEGRVITSFAILPSDSTAEARAEYKSLAVTNHLTGEIRPYQFRALAAAHVLVEGLRRAGRDVSRDRLIETLERLYEFPTGFTQPVSFGPSRRVGGAGAHLMRVDLRRKELMPMAMPGGAG